MAWTTPKTDFVSGNILTAAQMNAIGENLDAIGDPWIAYTPTWTNLTVGNATQSSAYLQAGKLHIVRIELVFGSTTSISGTPEFTLPAGVSFNSAYDTIAPVGEAVLVDASGLNYSALTVRSGAAARGAIQTAAVTGGFVYLSGLNATTPFTWTTSDKILATAVFEAA